MKTVFIVNPMAGQGKKIKEFIAKIENCIEKTGADAQIYITKCVGDARNFVKNYLENIGDARFIACGGDGTLSEVLNGAIGYERTEIGVIPIGTGNDFCRNFGDGVDFFDIESQIFSGCEKCDAIRYSTFLNGEETCGFSVNMVNIGFDCNVADMTAEMKKKPFVSGPFAYFLSILFCMIKKKGADLKIEIDEKIIHNGRLLLTSVANGAFCGGGIKSNPIALVSDGVMNVNIIKNIKRVQFIPLLPHYMDGTILDVKNIDRYLINCDCKKITIEPKSGKIRICIDGEIIDAGKTHFCLVEGAFNFVVPKKGAFLKKEEILCK